MTQNLAEKLNLANSQHETLSVGFFGATKPAKNGIRRLQVVFELMRIKEDEVKEDLRN